MAWSDAARAAALEARRAHMKNKSLVVGGMLLAGHSRNTVATTIKEARKAMPMKSFLGGYRNLHEPRVSLTKRNQAAQHVAMAALRRRSK